MDLIKAKIEKYWGGFANDAYDFADLESAKYSISRSLKVEIDSSLEYAEEMFDGFEKVFGCFWDDEHYMDIFCFVFSVFQRDFTDFEYTCFGNFFLESTLKYIYFIRTEKNIKIYLNSKNYKDVSNVAMQFELDNRAINFISKTNLDYHKNYSCYTYKYQNNVTVEASVITSYLDLVRWSLFFESSIIMNIALNNSSSTLFVVKEYLYESWIPKNVFVIYKSPEFICVNLQLDVELDWKENNLATECFKSAVLNKHDSDYCETI